MGDAKKTILVVDDEEDVVSYLATLFTDNGYEVIVAGRGGEAVRIAREKKPDLITLDITMPDESGVRAYRDIRGHENTRDIPIIIVTGYEDPNFRKFMYTRRTAPPPEGFFDKPVDRKALLDKVRELIGR